MIRVPKGFSTAIAEARAWIPDQILARLGHVRFFCGTDPVFAGLFDFTELDDGRSFRDTACCAWPHHLARPASERVTTVVLPVVEMAVPTIVIHELGHALDAALPTAVPVPDPVSEYAKTNDFEAFACAFEAWVDHPSRYNGDREILLQDQRTLRFFAELSA